MKVSRTRCLPRRQSCLAMTSSHSWAKPVNRFDITNHIGYKPRHRNGCGADSARHRRHPHRMDFMPRQEIHVATGNGRKAPSALNLTQPGPCIPRQSKPAKTVQILRLSTRTRYHIGLREARLVNELSVIGRDFDPQEAAPMRALVSLSLSMPRVKSQQGRAGPSAGPPPGHSQ